MRQAKILYKDTFAGILTETDDGEFQFQYDAQYFKDHPNDFLTFSMPVQEEMYRENLLFPFFEGLIPEGWLLEIASKSWKINKSDRMGLLLACCNNTIGAVSVQQIDNDEE